MAFFMADDGVFAKIQEVGDLAVGLAAGHEQADLALPAGEVEIGDAAHELEGQRLLTAHGDADPPRRVGARFQPVGAETKPAPGIFDQRCRGLAAGLLLADRFQALTDARHRFRQLGGLCLPLGLAREPRDSREQQAG